jgi:hypothetical protein
MKTVKVKIYKDPAGQGRYINKTSQFLEKAQYGMEKKATEDDITNTILDELTMDPDPDSIAYKLQGLYGLDYNTALNKITEVQDILYKEGTGESKNTVDAMVPETVVDDNRANRYNYGLNETSVVDDANYEGNTGWEDDESMEPDDLAQEDEAGLSIEKTGGAIGKRKFVKKLVRGLKKAAEGMQQDISSSASILDTPVDGRQTFINTFRRGIKDLGNEYYAKEIYSKMQTPPTPQMPMQQQAPMFAQNGAQVGDPENIAHHLLALSEANSKIFDQPMNQIHGAGFENTQEPMPIAQRGREQRQADRQTRNVNKDFNRAFGDMAAGYFGVPGMPNYMQVISPQMMQAPTGNPAGQPGQSGQSGPLIDLEYKKGPWWKGTREWSAKGVPMQMMMGAGAGMPGFGYMPQMQGYNTGSSYGNSRTFPGEVIRTNARILNKAADPAKNNESGDLKNSGTTVELLPQEMGNASGASVDRYNLELISSPTKPGVYYGKDASGILYQFTGNIGEHQVGKEPAGRIDPSNPTYSEVMGSIYKKAYGVGNTNTGNPQVVTGLGNDAPISKPTIDDETVDVINNPGQKRKTREELGLNGSELLFTKNRKDAAYIIKDGKYYISPNYSSNDEAVYDNWIEVTDPERIKQIKTFKPDQSKLYQGLRGNDFAYDRDMYGDWSYQTDNGYAPVTNPKSLERLNNNESIGNDWFTLKSKPGYYYRVKNDGSYVKFEGDPAKHNNSKKAIATITQKSDPKAYAYISKNLTWGGVDPNVQDDYKPLGFKNVPKTKSNGFEEGGFVDTSTMDPDTLARFIYGGGDNQSIEPIISYDDNDMQSKNTQDPYYSRGGMFKYQGTGKSQVKGSPLTPQELELARKYGINDPGFDIEGARNTIRSRQREEWIDGQMSGANNSGANRGYPQTGQQGNGAGIRASRPAPGYTWEEWNALPEATRTKIRQSLQGQRTQTQGGYYPQGNYGYPTAPSPGQQIKDMFSIWKRNPYTGSKTDFTWLSQNGLPRTMDGQVYQPQGQQGQTQNQKVAEVIDEYGNKKLMPLDQAEREFIPHKQVSNPMQAGYVQDYKYTKGPWFGGNKKTLSVTNRWMDPNNPNGGTSANTGQFNNGQGPIAFPGSNAAAPGTNTGTQQTNTPPVSPGAPTATPMGSAPVADTQERLSRRETLNNALDGNTRRGVKEYGPDIVNFTQARKQWEQSRADWKALPGDNNDYYKANVEPVADKMAQYDKSTDDYEANTSNRDKRRNFRDWKQGVLSEREYGGYVPDYDNLYKFQGANNSIVDFSGTGPSDPNNSLINNGGINMGGTGPCTEFEVSDPNSPCYDPSYLAKKASSANPQDFTVDYDINEAKTLNTTGIANLAGLGASAVQGVSAIKDNIYNDNLLAANTTSDNREATNELDYRGGYSGLNQRIMSKGQGRGSTGFNGIVGNAAFVKQGGQAGYSKGGVYDLTQEQIGAILAAGGQIEFI